MKPCGKNPDGTKSHYQCFKSGVGIGRNLQMKIEPTLPKDVLREIARQYNLTSNNKVKRLGTLTKAQIYNELIGRGVEKFKPIDLMK